MKLLLATSVGHLAKVRTFGSVDSRKNGGRVCNHDGNGRSSGGGASGDRDGTNRSSGSGGNGGSSGTSLQRFTRILEVHGKKGTTYARVTTSTLVFWVSYLVWSNSLRDTAPPLTDH